MMIRKRILFIYYEPFPSGQTAHVISLVKNLDREKFEIYVIIPDLLESLKPEFEAFGASVSVLSIRKILWRPSAIWGLTKTIQSIKPHIVHVHSQEAGLIARPIAWLAGTRKIFYTPQTIDIRRKKFQKLIVFFERILANLTNVIISVNLADKKRLNAWGIPMEKISVVYNGVDLQEITSFHPPSDALPQGNPIIIQLGRLSEQKNPIAFIEGANLVIHKIPETKCYMIGEGPLYDGIVLKIKELGLEKNIKLLGRIPHASHWLYFADVVTLTSLWEGTPYSLIEAMAWEKPIVATNVNGCKEVVDDGKTGYIVPAENIEVWAEKVVLLLEDKKKAALLGSNGRKRAEQLFSVRKMTEKISDLYHSHLKNYCHDKDTDNSLFIN